MKKELTSYKTYRYEIINNDAANTTILYVLHGYGQLAKYFIQKFKSLPTNLIIVAPEGMHRFYKKGSSGRVGASWMTKEEREIDISDNLNWLTALDNKLSDRHIINKRILLGFSQGGATALRWKWNAKINFDSTIIWASDFPPDIIDNQKFIIENNNYFVIGSDDEYYDQTTQVKVSQQYKTAGFKISTYLGRHDIDEITLNELINSILG